MNITSKKKILRIVQVFFIFFLTIGVAGYFSFLGVDPHHDGIMLKPASDIMHGQMLFRDTFTQYGAFTTILQSWALSLFGNYLYVIKMQTVLFYGVIVVMLWLVWSLFIPGYLATSACIIWLFLAPYYDPSYPFLPWSSVYSLFFQLLTLYTLLQFILSGKRRWQLIAGAAAALTFWSRQPVGFLLVTCIMFYFFILKLKNYKIQSIVPFLISHIVIHIFFFLWILTNNAFTDWFYQTIHYPAVWAVSASPEKIILFMNFMRNLFPTSYSPISIWTMLPLIILYLAFSCITSKKINNKRALVLLAACVCLASWLQYQPVYDPHHWYWAASPMIGFVLYAALNLGVNKKKNTILLVICLLLFVPDTFYHTRLARRKIRKFWSYPKLSTPTILKDMRVPPDEKKFFDEAMIQLSQFKEKNPNSFITTTGRDALYTLFDGKNKNCYKFTVDWGWEAFDPQLKKNYLEAMRRCISHYKPAVFTQKFYYQRSPVVNSFSLSLLLYLQEWLHYLFITRA